VAIAAKLLAEGVASGAVRRHTTDGSGGGGGVADGGGGANKGRVSSPRVSARTTSPGVLAVIGIAVVIALLTIVTYGQVREGVFLALVVFILFGAIVPPVAIALGAVMIVALLMRGAGTKVFDWLGALAKAQPVAAPSNPDIGTAPPGYQPYSIYSGQVGGAGGGSGGGGGGAR